MNKIIARLYIIFISLVIIIASSYLLIWYLNQSIIPQKIKSFLIQSIEKQTNYTVKIKKLKFNLIKGFELSDIIVADKQKPQETLFSADKIYFKAVPVPSFSGIKVMVPFIDVLSAQATIKRDEKGAWNIQPASVKNGKLPQIYIIRVSFSGSKIFFSDNYNNAAFSRTIDVPEGKIGLSLPRALSFSFSANAPNDNSPATAVSASGNYYIQNKNLSLTIDVKDLLPADYLNVYSASDNFKLTSGSLDIKAAISAVGLKKIKLNGKAQLYNSDIAALNARLRGSGNAHGNISFEIGNPDSLFYDINYNIANAMALLDNPYMDKIRIANSSGTLQTKLWDIKTFEGSIYEGPITLSGTIANPLKDPKVKINIASEFDIVNLKNSKNFGLLEGIVKIDAVLSGDKKTGYIIKGVSGLKSLKLGSDSFSAEGNFDIRGEFGLDTTGKTISHYKGTMLFDKATIGVSSSLPFIENAKGEVLFQTKSATIKDLTGYVSGSRVFVSGNLDYAKEPAGINIKISARELDVNKLILSLPDTIKEKLADINLTGIADLDIEIKNTDKKSEPFTYKGYIKLSAGSASTAYLKDSINDINAGLIFEKDRLSWDKLSCSYKNNLYISSGFVSRFDKPVIDASLESKDLNLKGIVTIDGELLNVQGLNASYKTYSIAGLNGYVKNFRQPNLQAVFQAANLKLGKLNLGSMNLGLIKEDKLISATSLTLNPYGGVVNVTGRLNLEAEKKPYLININANNIDLQKAVLDAKLSSKTEKIKGLISGAAALNGYFDDENSLKGNGWLQVQEGYLGDFPVVYGLVDILLGIPAEYLTLTDAFGNFSISNKRLYTSDFKMLSQKAAILWEGSVGFDGTLDFNITGRFAEDIVKMTTNFGKIASAVLKEAGAYIVEIRLTGTIDKPKYSVVPFAVEKMLKEKVVDKIKDALGKIFD
ncbi:MAG: hypothetical protein JW946_03550 [Candidatus Omnitrophica bacterium]|nr:hypothetical protein [Candidatus Omnitrophota bacterium]